MNLIVLDSKFLYVVRQGCLLAVVLGCAAAIFSACSSDQQVVDDHNAIPPTSKLLDPQSRDQDDMCLWVHPEDPALSLIISSDKVANKLFVYDLDGQTVQTLDVPRPGNVDLRYDFPFGDGQVDIVALNQRDQGFRIRVYAVDHMTRQLSRIDDNSIETGDSHGGTLFRSPVTRKMYFIKTSSDYGLVEQFELFDGGDGSVKGRKIREWTIGGCEAAVADDRSGKVFIADEENGIYAVDGDPEGSVPGELIIKVGENGLQADVEGLAIYTRREGGGYLIASNQSQNSFSLYKRRGKHEFVGSFSIKGARHSDGIDVCSGRLNDAFPYGLFICHSDPDGSENEAPCPLLVTAWQDIADVHNFSVDNTWNPRQ